jgi:hypothetical protein
MESHKIMDAGFSLYIFSRVKSSLCARLSFRRFLKTSLLLANLTEHNNYSLILLIENKIFVFMMFFFYQLCTYNFVIQLIFFS